ncbi:MAG: hypothetical protein AAB511_03250 [Patescibacteria group bacterium]
MSKASQAWRTVTLQMLDDIASGRTTPEAGSTAGEEAARRAIEENQRPRVRILPHKPHKTPPPIQLDLRIRAIGKRKPPLPPRTN